MSTPAWKAIRPASGQRPSPTKKFKIKLMGHFSTGTNYLLEVLEANFGAKVEISENAKGTATIKGCQFWKHTLLTITKQREPQRFAQCAQPEWVGLAMVRNPLAWLQAMKNTGYDLERCVKGADWLTRPCSYPVNVMFGMEFPNLPKIWTRWTQSYEQLSTFGFKRSMLIRYEDLILNTSGVLSQVAVLLNLPFRVDDLVQVESEARHHESTIPVKDAHAQAVSKIVGKTYLSKFSSKEFSDACRRLDHEIMHRLKYRDCDKLTR